MKSKLPLITCLLLLAGFSTKGQDSPYTYAQKEAINWYFGFNAGLASIVAVPYRCLMEPW